MCSDSTHGSVFSTLFRRIDAASRLHGGASFAASAVLVMIMPSVDNDGGLWDDS